MSDDKAAVEKKRGRPSKAAKDSKVFFKLIVCREITYKMYDFYGV